MVQLVLATGTSTLFPTMLAKSTPNETVLVVALFGSSLLLAAESISVTAAL